MSCPVICETKNSVLSFDLVLRVYEYISPFCNEVLLPFLLLLVYEFIQVITLRFLTVSFYIAGL